MAIIGGVSAVLSQISAIHSKKNEDYSTPGQSFENFDRAAELISWFKEDHDKTYVNHIATKLARLATLLGNREPNNESINDTFLDLCTYCVLWYANYEYREIVKRGEKV